MQQAALRGDAARGVMDVEGAKSSKLRGGRARRATQSVDDAEATTVGSRNSNNLQQSDEDLEILMQPSSQG